MSGDTCLPQNTRWGDYQASINIFHISDKSCFFPQWIRITSTGRRVQEGWIAGRWLITGDIFLHLVLGHFASSLAWQGQHWSVKLLAKAFHRNQALCCKRGALSSLTSSLSNKREMWNCATQEMLWFWMNNENENVQHTWNLGLPHVNGRYRNRIMCWEKSSVKSTIISSCWRQHSK